MRRVPVLPTLLVLGAVAIMIGLGVWQLHRLRWKEELLARSDFVSLNCDLNATSVHLMSDRQFSRMKPGAVVINTARGPIIDEPALVRALKAKPIDISHYRKLDENNGVAPYLRDILRGDGDAPAWIRRVRHQREIGQLIEDAESGARGDHPHQHEPRPEAPSAPAHVEHG